VTSKVKGAKLGIKIICALTLFALSLVFNKYISGIYTVPVLGQKVAAVDEFSLLNSAVISSKPKPSGLFRKCNQFVA